MASMIVHDIRVCFSVNPVHSLTSRKPVSFMRESTVDPGAIAIVTSPTSGAVKSPVLITGAISPAVVTIVTVAEPCDTRWYCFQITKNRVS